MCVQQGVGHSGIGGQAGLRRLWLLVVMALAAGALAMRSTDATLQLALAASAATLVFISTGYIVFLLWDRGRNRVSADGVADFIAKDAAPSFIATSDRQVIYRNEVALKQFGKVGEESLAQALRAHFANPVGLLYRLQSRATASGNAREEVITRSGPMRLSVHQLSADRLLWRIESVATREGPRSTHESMALPMAMLGRGGAILFMNEAARILVGQRVKSLDRLFNSLPLTPGTVTEIATAEGNRQVLVAEVEAGANRRALYLLPPPEGAPSPNELGWETFQDLPVPMIKLRPDGTVLAFNRMAGKLLGVSLRRGTHLSHLMEGLGRSISDWLQDSLAGRLVQKSEFLRLTRTDQEVFVQVSLNRISEAGEAALIAVLQDATELKSLEAQFVQSQKMQAIGQLAGGVAHDFNNLLTAISGHCDLLLLRHDQGDPDFSDLVQINQNANRAAALVGQLLAFSRKQTLRPETLDMRDTLADLTHLLNRLVGEKVTLTLSHDPVLAPIRADKRQLEQVLMNLVVNARDAMPAGGEIRIVTEVTSLDQPLERDRVSVPAGRYVTVQVHDDGTGIPKDKLQKVFEPFFTTKRTGEGTGLGLSTAYGIVKQTGGFIFLDSELGRGTCFTLYFPVLEGQPTAVAKKPPASPAQSPLQRSDGVILLVEDEAPVRAFASRALRLRGYTVLEAESAEAALMMLEDKELDIDVFVTDVVMPGMDGPSWVRQALKQRPDVRVVFVSGYAEDNFGQEQSKIPNSVFLPKPFSLTDLTTTVHNQLH
ncbi:response regulator [Sulfitobacter sp. KE34]|nr:response regulator [Sulfitobacter sp. KE12]MDF3353104.1 response regulator [Sulfitobacter sp. KE27]MDF3356751.1 response regulator [Sulfitobacter sp. KE33]MDF3359586.1 response regulator [Sulfitobacter sp. Ks41]MDF3364175.1 response regulator [Sulfitobacter sp. Ks34]MDF3367784.1 response regulator [Sulfitobacter sp. Ks43]MDF3371433.1 response regulator [Sulfitobacter sp. KS8]MDF3375071.1 response regulator [Sulfitobacter sp. KE37]MDF3378737.1 response regulator [Sulfitobacter sp. KE32]M